MFYAGFVHFRKTSHLLYFSVMRFASSMNVCLCQVKLTLSTGPKVFLASGVNLSVLVVCFLDDGRYTCIKTCPVGRVCMAPMFAGSLQFRSLRENY